MSGGKGGGQTTTAEIPEWAKEPTIRNLQRAEDVQQMVISLIWVLTLQQLTPRK